MTTPIRWGILATGGIARRFVEDLSLLPDAVVAAVGSRSSGSAERFAADYGIPRAHGSWQALAEDPEVDVVYVATPHSAHHAAALACLDAGKAVLCEKPLTVDAAQARSLIDAARDSGAFLMEAMWMRCFPAIRRLREDVAGGGIGRVTTLHADFGLVAPDDPGHRLRSPALAGGALLDLGIYVVTLAQLLLGPPAQVTARATLSAEGVDENTSIILGYGSGALATLTCSLVADSHRTAVVAGTEGRIELPRHFHKPKHYTVYKGDEGSVVRMPYEGLGFHFEAAEVHRCLREGLVESPLVPWADTLAVMETLDEVRRQIGVAYPEA